MQKLLNTYWIEIMKEVNEVMLANFYMVEKDLNRIPGIP